MTLAQFSRHTLALVLFLLFAAAHAATPGASSSKYGIVTDTIDAGGLLTSSAKYSNIGSVGGIEGSSATVKYAAGHGYIAQVVVADTTKTIVTPVTLVYTLAGQSVPVSATVTSQGNPVNSGTVTFQVKTKAAVPVNVGSSATSNVIAGVANANYTIPSGTNADRYTIQADYNPTSGLADSTSRDDFVISKADASITTTNLSVQFSSVAQALQIDVAVTSTIGTVNEGLASAQIKDANTNVGTVAAPKTVVNGTASLVYALPANTPVKVYTLEVSYSSTNYANATNTPPNTFTVVASDTTVHVTSTTYLLNSVANLPRLTAQIFSGSSVNEGTVTFSVFNSSNQLVGSPVDSTTVTNGIAQVDYLLPLGTPQGMYTVMAAYKNSANFNPKTDTGPLNLIANTDPNAAVFLGAIQSSRNPARTNVPITFSVNVDVTGPLGNVTFQWRVYSVSNGNLTLLQSIDTTSTTTRTFSAPGTYIVKVDVSSGTATSKTFDYVAVSLDPNADGAGKNIADSKVDPAPGAALKVNVGDSLAGVVDIDFTPSTAIAPRDFNNPFGTVLGRSDNIVRQNDHTAFKFTESEIVVVQVMDVGPNQTVGAVVAQRMLAISQREIARDVSTIIPPAAFTFTKPSMTAKFNFKANTNRKDTLALAYTFSLPGGIDFKQDQFVYVGIGNAIIKVKMDTKGKKGFFQPPPPATNPSPIADTSLKTFTLSYRAIPKATSTTVNTAGTIKLSLTSSDLVANGFKFVGINPNPGNTVTIPATPIPIETLMVFRGVTYRQVINAIYSCKKGVGQLVTKAAVN